MTLEGFISKKERTGLMTDFLPAVIGLNHVTSYLLKALYDIGFTPHEPLRGKCQIRLFGKTVNCLDYYSKVDINAGDDEELFIELAKRSFNKDIFVYIPDDYD